MTTASWFDADWIRAFVSQHGAWAMDTGLGSRRCRELATLDGTAKEFARFFPNHVT
jgi:hypothetical protein